MENGDSETAATYTLVSTAKMDEGQREERGIGKVLTAGTLLDGRHTWRSFTECLFFTEYFVVVCRVFYFLRLANKLFVECNYFIECLSVGTR